MKPSPEFRARALLETGLSALAFVGSLAVNYLFIGGGNRIREVSDRYLTPLTPAPYTFSIWGIIYLFGVFSIGVWLFYAVHDEANFMEQRSARYTMFLVSILNALWIFAWVNEKVITAWVLIVSMLGLLVLNDNIQRKHLIHPQPLLTDFSRAFYGLYYGWITVAALLNTLVVVNALVPYNVTDGLIAPILLWLLVIFSAWQVRRTNSAYGLAVLWASVGILRQRFHLYDLNMPALLIFFAVLFLAGFILHTELKNYRRHHPRKAG